ncbi:MAG: hypothetical protein GY775_01145 [Candidatus Scalindua sp.]|nr:hypothetical protein [Candidatus Scalindua sp.]
MKSSTSIISLLEKEPVILNRIIETQETELRQLKTSYKEQRIDNLIGSLKVFFIGLAVGLMGGFYLGFTVR